MPDVILDVLRQVLDRHGYTLQAEQLPEACAHHPEQVCALLSAAGTIAATGMQISVLTEPAHLLCDAHNDGDSSSVLFLRERLDQVADALTAALTPHDKAIAALHRTCKALARTDIPVVVASHGSTTAEGHANTATEPTP
ncbi:hypothetical protein [Micromonospora costi]|uniref:Uncharacterized protein n=1 Tax=Micromonospora costi TaxID=1530042 RepID=A0A3B0A5Z3_9ACTN|nr:hypothetical protein [Micromonospora costi]RKN55276.1 hypothetical protein D7193_11310 [Micromonospora costi]